MAVEISEIDSKEKLNPLSPEQTRRYFLVSHDHLSLSLSGKTVIHTSEGLALPVSARDMQLWSKRAGPHPQNG